MAQYKVSVAATVTVFRNFTVEAASQLEAEQKAVVEAKADHLAPAGWDDNGELEEVFANECELLPAPDPEEPCGMCGHPAEEHRCEGGWGACQNGAGCGGKCPCGQFESHESH
jgi:hypothetical protein